MILPPARHILCHSLSLSVGWSSGLLVTNIIWLRWRNVTCTIRKLHKIVMFVLLTGSLVWWSKCQYWRHPGGRKWGWSQATASRELKPSIQQPWRKWVQPTATWVSLEVSLQSKPLSWPTLWWQPHERPRDRKPILAEHGILTYRNHNTRNVCCLFTIDNKYRGLLARCMPKLFKE